MGQGPIIVLLHGFMEDSSIWNSLLLELPQDYHWVAIDLPGHGESTSDMERYTMEYLAKRVQAVLNHLNCEVYQCIGHSMGGYVGLALAKKDKSKCKGLVLLNSTFEADDPQRKKDRVRSAELTLKNPKSYVQMAMTNLFHAQSREMVKDDMKKLIHKAQQMNPKSIAAAHLGMKDRVDELATFLQVEHNLAIIGKEDSVLDAEDLTSKCELHSIPVRMLEGGHMSWLENPDGVIQSITSFLR